MLEQAPGKLKTSVGCCPRPQVPQSPQGCSGLAVADRWLSPAALTSAGPSSAFRLANSSAMVFCSFAVFDAVVTFSGGRGKNTDGCQHCGCSVLKQQIPKFMGNDEISTLLPGTYGLHGDMQFNIDGDLPLGKCPGYER